VYFNTVIYNDLIKNPQHQTDVLAHTILVENTRGALDTQFILPKMKTHI